MPYDSDIIVIGCGNILFKDDGFGPVLINILQKYFPIFIFITKQPVVHFYTILINWPKT